MNFYNWAHFNDESTEEWLRVTVRAAVGFIEVIGDMLE